MVNGECVEMGVGESIDVSVSIEFIAHNTVRREAFGQSHRTDAMQQ